MNRRQFIGNGSLAGAGLILDGSSAFNYQKNTTYSTDHFRYKRALNILYIDSQNDKWNWETIIEDNWNTRYKRGEINFVGNMMHFVNDANGEKPYDRGIFRCKPEDITDKSKHKLLYQPNYESANMIIQDNVIIATHYATASPWSLGIIYSPDLGAWWYEYDLKEYGPRSAMRLQYKNSEGWFRADIRSGWLNRAEVLFIKPK